MQRSKRLYSYVLKSDTGAAPNPFWGTCTLTICKPKIRKLSDIGDWIVGTGSSQVPLESGRTADFSYYLVYAMKVTDKKTLQQYDIHCKAVLKKKIPNFINRKDWRLRMGDCIYEYSGKKTPIQRKGVHNESNFKTDLGGMNALLSQNFYYFGDRPILIPTNLLSIIKKNQGHRKITDVNIIQQFEKWILQYKKNKLYGQPQLKHKFQTMADKNIYSFCSSSHLDD